ncbi:MAG TPA: hypothetical protein VHL59_05385, partial [Thermoanaerobaculia bacterium]|nr:hypothetical protein [Thermoanaerobaculia bacterium]
GHVHRPPRLRRRDSRHELAHHRRLQHGQQNVYDVIPSVQTADRAQPNFYITWSATAPLFVYASVVDNKTGDSVYID